MAVYQTAVDRPGSASELGWRDAHRVIEDAVRQFAPVSVGINLVQLADTDADPLPLVERAARLLADC